MIDLILKNIWLHPIRWLVAIAIIITSFFVICSGNNSKTNTEIKENSSLAEKPINQESVSPNSLIESSQTPDSPDQPAEPAPDLETNNETAERRDPVVDETEEDVLEGKSNSAQRAALPFLPVKTGSIEGEYKNQLSSGLLLIEVRYRSSKAEAIKDWQKFLDKYKDPGTAYLVVYKPV